MNPHKVSEEVAEADITRWLDACMIRESKRYTMKDTIKELVNYVMDGDIIVSEDGKIKQVLQFPVGEESQITELNFKNRIGVDDIHKRMTGNNVKAGDIDGRIRVYASALTGQPYALIGKLDTSDWSVTSTISSFFF
jgi:hypothetical protein